MSSNLSASLRPRPGLPGVASHMLALLVVYALLGILFRPRIPSPLGLIHSSTYFYSTLLLLSTRLMGARDPLILCEA